MNILHLHEKTSIDGGAEVYINQFLNLSHDLGMNSHWIGVRQLKEKGHMVSCANTGTESEIKNLEDVFHYLKKYIEENRVDLIHIHSLSYPALIRKCFGLRPLVRSMREPRMFCPGHGKFWRFSEQVCNKPFGMHCLYHAYKEGCAPRNPEGLLKGYQNTYFEMKEAAAQYHTIIAQSYYMERESVRSGLPAEKVVMIPNFTQKIEEDQLVEKPQKSLLYLGRLIQHKGPHLMIKAVIPLLRKYPDWTLDLVGDGIEGQKYRSMVEESGMSDRIIFHGWKDRKYVYQVLKEAYMVIFPSIYPEAFGITGIEAMMHAKPVVAFDVGGIPTWLDHEETGFAVPHKDHIAMSEKIEHLMTDEQLYKRMSNRARERALERFTPDTHFRKMLEIYHAAVAGKVQDTVISR